MHIDNKNLNSELKLPLRVRLVLGQRGWILEKFAIRLAENLPNWDVNVDIDSKASPDVDFNHWMVYLDTLAHSDEDIKLSSTIFITHVDRFAKLLVLKKRLEVAEMAICMSQMTVDYLAEHGVDKGKLTFITPGHDGMIKPRRIVLGITSRLRLDGAKREDILLDVAKRMRLIDFHFDIIGSGWESVIPHLQNSGATVDYYLGNSNGMADYKINIDRVPRFDYYLYLGFDEGSMGILDALAAGVPTIVTPQGFHLDIPNGITHSFCNAEELLAVLRKIAAERQVRQDAVAALSWDNYARQHAIIWRAILDGRHSEIPFLLHGPLAAFSKSHDIASPSVRWRHFFRWVLNLNALSTEAHYLFRQYAGLANYNRLRKIKRIILGHRTDQ